MNRMVHALLNLLLARRAERILNRIRPYVPATGTVLDIGSGTGHNAAAIGSAFLSLHVIEADVVTMNFHDRPSPLLIRDGRLPVADQSVDAGLLLYVLHYCDDPQAVLSEASRVIRGPLLVLQTTAGDRISRLLWRWRDAFLGRYPFHLCAALGVIARSHCPMRPRHWFDRDSLTRLAESAGWTILHLASARWAGTTLSRDLFVLERDTCAGIEGNSPHVSAVDHRARAK